MPTVNSNKIRNKLHLIYMCMYNNLCDVHACLYVCICVCTCVLMYVRTYVYVRMYVYM